MTTEPIDINEQQARLDWMRAEFRTAQQRQYDARRPSVKDVSVAEPTPPSEVEPPSLANPSR
jgi:hypothetical protein